MQIKQLGKFPNDPDDLDDGELSDLASKLRKDALQLINSFNMSAPVLSRMRSLLNRLPDHTLPDVIASIVRSTTEEKLKVRNLRFLRLTFSGLFYACFLYCNFA